MVGATAAAAATRTDEPVLARVTLTVREPGVVPGESPAEPSAQGAAPAEPRPPALFEQPVRAAVTAIVVTAAPTIVLKRLCMRGPFTSLCG